MTNSYGNDVSGYCKLRDSEGVLGIIRVQRLANLVHTVQALAEGGIRFVEVTMNTPRALEVIAEAAKTVKSVRIGAGTVLDSATARQAILAGADFIVTPTVEMDVIETARRYGVEIISGAMTPTEILKSWEAGATMVKVFPADILGPAYIKAVRGPLPQIPLAPTGGITADNAGEFIRAGAAMVCAGGWLVDKEAVANERYEVLTERARQLVNAVRKAREEMA